MNRSDESLTSAFFPRAPSLAALAPWRPFLDLVLAYWLLSALVGHFVGWRGPAFTVTLAIGAGAIGFAMLLTLVSFIAAGLARGWPVARAEARTLTGRAMVIIAAAVLVSAVFTGWRASIPVVHPFAWDARLDALDVALHGTRPWLLAHAAFVHPWLAKWFPDTVEWVYSQGWFFANLGVVLILALRPVGPRSQRVLVAYVLQYAVLGSLIATLISSAGPIFYGSIVPGPDPYRELIPSLAATFPAQGTFQVLSFHEILWTAYQRGNGGLTTGITAFPSIHVSSAVLMALAAGSWHGWAGIVGWAVAILTLFGSVALGWHYAVDGYASIVGMLALWWLAGRIVRAYP